MSRYKQALPPGSVSDNTAQVGPIIDRFGYSGSVNFLIHAGTLTIAGATFTPLIEHGNAANLSDAAAVTTAALGLKGTLAAATFAGTNSNTLYSVGYAGNKRYVRLTVTPATNSGAASLSAIAILDKPNFSAGTTASEP